MNPPQVYTCSPSWTPFPPPSLYHPSGSSHCTSPKHPVSCIERGLVIHFLYDIIHVSMPFSQIIPPSPSPTESQRLFYTSGSLLLSHIQGYPYHLSKWTPILYHKTWQWRYIRAGIFLWVLIFEEYHDLENAHIEKHPKQILKWHLGLMYHIFHP